MCVLASAVDIFSSHPSRGGDWLPSWSPPRFVFIPLDNATASREILCMLVMREGGGETYTIYTSYEREDLEGN